MLYLSPQMRETENAVEWRVRDCQRDDDPSVAAVPVPSPLPPAVAAAAAVALPAAAAAAAAAAAPIKLLLYVYGRLRQIGEGQKKPLLALLLAARRLQVYVLLLPEQQVP